MKAIKVLGVMSGSSLDGQDMSVVEFREEKGKMHYKIIDAITIAYPENLRKRLSKAPSMSAKKLMIDYTKALSTIVQRWIKKKGHEFDFVSSHGHTIFHYPEKGLSKQIGNGGVLAKLTGYPVVCDFRNGDIALGGQGTPMAPLADRDLFPGHDMYLNMGGIANITFFLKGKMSAYDICPCNQLLNYLSNQKGKAFDQDGKWASKGNINEALYHALGSNPYYQLSAPKSMDNQWIRENVFIVLDAFTIPIEDKLNTVAHFIVEKIMLEIQQQGYNKKCSLFVTGGGTHNIYLAELLKEKMSIIGVHLIVPNPQIIDFKESVLIAYAGYLRILEQSNMISEVTGAKRDSIGGCIYLP